MCSAWIIQNLVCFCKKLFRNYNDTLFIVLFLQQMLLKGIPVATVMCKCLAFKGAPETAVMCKCLAFKGAPTTAVM